MSTTIVPVSLVDDFDSGVFINCPFDPDYKELLRPLLFTVVILGYHPRLSSERSDSGEYRLSKICEFIISSKYSIHDLSRIQATEVGEFARMNMPFELGIDYGTRLFGPEFATKKRFLILETEHHDYKIALSDLSGVDIKSHHDNASEIVRSVRDWFYETVGRKDAEPPKVIWNRFNEFTTWLFKKRIASGIPERDVNEDIERMSESEFVDLVLEWTQRN